MSSESSSSSKKKATKKSATPSQTDEKIFPVVRAMEIDISEERFQEVVTKRPDKLVLLKPLTEGLMQAKVSSPMRNMYKYDAKKKLVRRLYSATDPNIRIPETSFTDNLKESQTLRKWATTEKQKTMTDAALIYHLFEEGVVPRRLDLQAPCLVDQAFYADEKTLECHSLLSPMGKKLLGNYVLVKADNRKKYSSAQQECEALWKRREAVMAILFGEEKSSDSAAAAASTPKKKLKKEKHKSPAKSSKKSKKDKKSKKSHKKRHISSSSSSSSNESVSEEEPESSSSEESIASGESSSSSSSSSSELSVKAKEKKSKKATPKPPVSQKTVVAKKKKRKIDDEDSDGPELGALKRNRLETKRAAAAAVAEKEALLEKSPKKVKLTVVDEPAVKVVEVVTPPTLTTMSMAELDNWYETESKKYLSDK